MPYLEKKCHDHQQSVMRIPRENRRLLNTNTDMILSPQRRAFGTDSRIPLS